MVRKVRGNMASHQVGTTPPQAKKQIRFDFAKSYMTSVKKHQITQAKTAGADKVNRLITKLFK